MSVSSNTPDSNTANNTASDSDTVVTNADLSVTKSDGVMTVTAGDGVTHTYTITVKNLGPSDAMNASLNDTWPSGFTRTGITTTQGTCSPATGNGNFSCTLARIAAGASATVTANYTVPATTPAGNQTTSGDALRHLRPRPNAKYRSGG